MQGSYISIPQTLNISQFWKTSHRESSPVFLPFITLLYISKFKELTSHCQQVTSCWHILEKKKKSIGKGEENKSVRKITISIFIINEGNKTSRLMKAQVFHLYLFWDKNSFKQQLTSLAFFVPLSDCHRWCRISLSDWSSSWR